MKKRIRKKKRIGEFQEFGFKVGFRFSSEIDTKSRNDLIERFIKKAIEDNCLQFGGGGGGNEWDGFVNSDKPRESTTNSHQNLVEQWLIQEPMVFEYYVTTFIDSWNGDFDNIEIKWKNKKA